MIRDLRKSIAEYERKYFNGSSRAGVLYASDHEQIRTMAGDSLHNAIWYALEAGFMIGYRARKAEERRERGRKNREVKKFIADNIPDLQ